MKKLLKSFFILAFCIGVLNANFSDNVSKKYSPKTKQELKVLVNNPSVNLGEIDTSAITDMSSLFALSKRTDFSGIDSWDVSNVRDMSHMFYETRFFNQPLNNWDVSNVKDMSHMFEGASSFSQDLSSWDVSDKPTVGMLEETMIQNDTKKHPKGLNSNPNPNVLFLI